MFTLIQTEWYERTCVSQKIFKQESTPSSCLVFALHYGGFWEYYCPSTMHKLHFSKSAHSRRGNISVYTDVSIYTISVYLPSFPDWFICMFWIRHGSLEIIGYLYNLCWQKIVEEVDWFVIGLHVHVSWGSRAHSARMSSGRSKVFSAILRGVQNPWGECAVKRQTKNGGHCLPQCNIVFLVWVAERPWLGIPKGRGVPWQDKDKVYWSAVT